MSKLLQTVNFILALVLAGICLVQWRRERDYHAEIVKLDKTRQEQLITIAQNEKQIHGYQEDIADFKKRVEKMQASLEEQESVITSNRLQIARLDSITNQMAQAIDAWKKGVADRDEAIKKQNDSIRKLAGERDDMVKKYNALAKSQNEVVEKYNDLVKQVNEEREAQRKAQEDAEKKKKQ